MDRPAHVPVMLDRILELLEPAIVGRSEPVVVDATLGLGGHAEALLTRFRSVRLIGIDRDPAALALARERLDAFADRLTAAETTYDRIADVLASNDVAEVAGVLLDLGVSSMQLDSESRGFSFRFDAPLDMRMDTDSDAATAADLLATLGQDELAYIIYQYGEERHSRKIARWIIEKRDAGTPITTTVELADLVRRAVPRSSRDKIHPATRTFQALRIAVNRELEILDNFVSDSVELLSEGGVLAIITFHSLEDRAIKQAFQRHSGKCSCPPRIPQCICGAKREVEILTRKPVTAGEPEIQNNPRARSAKLRACRKLPI